MPLNKNKETPIDLKIWLDDIDTPSKSKDSLCRCGFVDTLTETLVNSPHNRSLVTAVFGPWGSGKSWILEQLHTSLVENPKKTTVCRFAPWEMKSQDQILAEFFSTISEALPTEPKHKNLSSLWDQLEQISIVGSIGAATFASTLALSGSTDENIALAIASKSVLGSLSKLFGRAKTSSEELRSLSSIKKELTRELQKNLDHPIIVLIDDMDRLTDGEIQMMIRLLNTTANLPQIHYIIFGDRKQIAAALNPICGNEGDRYLEKIVHNSLQVPEPSKTQIQMRLSEGLKIIASTVNTEFDTRDERYQNYWKNFISHRVLNLRDAHRLLRTVSFHASALSRNGKLEVEILDLLGVDFLRLFDPASYRGLANGPLIQSMILQWRPPTREEKDDVWLLDLIEKSKLPPATVVGAIISLFPDSQNAISNYLKKQQLTSLICVNNTKRPSPLSIGNVKKTYIYFQLELAAGDIPEIEYQSFLLASHDLSELSQKMQKFKKHNWYLQLFYRLKTAPKEILEQANIKNILLAISNTSDSLKYKPGTADHELKSAFRLVGTLVESVDPMKRAKIISNAIRSSKDVTLPLLLIEYFRDVSKCTYHDGATAPSSIPLLNSEDIERLSDNCLLKVIANFSKNTFMRDNNEAARAYRMAHALGPERTEQVLQKDLSVTSGEKTWKLMETIATSMSPKYQIDWMDRDDISNNNYGAPLRKELLQFASDNFWDEFITQYNASTDFSKRLVQHLNIDHP